MIIAKSAGRVKGGAIVARREKPVSEKSGGLNGSVQHLLEVFF